MFVFDRIYFYGILCTSVTLFGDVIATTTLLMTTTPMIISASMIICTPDPIFVNISTQQPVNSFVEVPINCTNWRDKQNLEFDIVNSFDEKRYFRAYKFNDSIGVFLRLELLRKDLKPQQWNTSIIVLENVTEINTIPIHIQMLEMNDPPAIHPDGLVTEVREDVATGHLIRIFSFSDPDTGEMGELGNVYSQDKPEEIEIIQAPLNTVELRTSKALDAEKYTNYNQSGGLDIERSVLGPRIKFSLIVEDKLGLASAATINLTIIDIGDENPFCNSSDITLKIPVRKMVVSSLITSLQGNCYGRNYNNDTVSYSLIHDSCNGFRVSSSGEVRVIKATATTRISCSLIVQATDVVFINLKTNVSINIAIISCPADTDDMGNQWEKGSPGNKTIKKCPQGYSGIATRYCNEDGKYLNPVYNCTSSTIDGIYKEMKKITAGGKANASEIIEVLDNLDNVTSGKEGNTLLIGDMDTTNRILSEVTRLITVNITNIEDITNSFMETADNILDESTTRTWGSMINETGSGADSVLENIDRYVEKVIGIRNTTILLPKANLYLKTASVSSCSVDIQFPSRNTEQVPVWAAHRRDQLVVACSDSAQSYSGVVYRNLSKIISSRTGSNRSATLMLNSPVMSFTFYPVMHRKLDNKVEITFQLYNNDWENTSCSFWTKPNSSPGFWSEEGCRRKPDAKRTDTVVCECDHLTNFAVLMSPSFADLVDAGHITALRIISIVGCTISMICLLLTVAAHVYFWRFVKSVRSILHINLSCALFLAYAVFLAGVDRTEIKVLCTVIAVLLHLLFLIVFFIMLTEGLHLAYSVLKPLSTRKPGIPLLIASYVVSVAIVAASMGVAKMEGYGNDKSCWLSTESGLIWAFIVPVLVIITINGIVIGLVIWKMCSTVAMSRKSSNEKARAAARCVFILMPIMGVTWVFGVFSVSEDTLVFQYLFAIFNSIQGVLIFVCHCVKNKKLKEAYRQQKWKLLTSFSSGSSGTEGRRNLKQETSKVKTQTSTM